MDRRRDALRFRCPACGADVSDLDPEPPVLRRCDVCETVSAAPRMGAPAPPGYPRAVKVIRTGEAAVIRDG